MAETNKLTQEQANELVLEHQGWAESIARSVARAWSMDWKLDGLDGAALEALIFCSRRYDPSRGIPFKGYARKRVHEASTDAARQSKGWKRGSAKTATYKAREISVDLLNIFPELRMGHLPDSGDGKNDSRGAVRQLLVGAAILATKQDENTPSPDEVADYKKMVEVLASLEIIHQEIIWQLYYEGKSMRGLATEWDTDELNVIREHKALLTYMNKSLTVGGRIASIRVRPGLKNLSIKIKRTTEFGRFTAIMKRIKG